MLIERPSGGTSAFVLATVLAAVTGCGAGGSGAPLGEDCLNNAACASGMCIETNFTRSYCSAPCSAASDCTGADVPLVLTCDTAAGNCVHVCLSGQTQGSGAGTQICGSGGLFVACSSLDAVSSCDACGCEPFGGGTCVAGMGCVMPQPDGAACTIDAQCTSGACLRDTHQCGAPRAMGGACHVDAECATHNCSTDGNASMAGVCNQSLGTPCTQDASGSRHTATCTDCQVSFDYPGGVCFRAACDPTNAPNCQDFDNHPFQCAAGGTDGRYHCYETCSSTIHRCYYSTYACYEVGDYCR